MFRRKRPEPPRDEPHRPHGFFRRRPRRRSHWIYILALIGLAAVAFLLIKYLIIPLLVLVAQEG